MQKFIILCIIRISNFTARLTTRPVCFSPAGCRSRLQCRTTEHWSVYLIARSHPVRRPRLCVLMRGEIWYCRWACYDVYARHGVIVAATVDATVSAIVCQTHGNRQPAGREFDGISEANNTTSVFLDVRRIDWRRYRGQKCRNVGKLLHFPSWNVSWLNSWRSNPMYNTHPKLYSKILGKKCVLYPRFYGMYVMCVFLSHSCTP